MNRKDKIVEYMKLREYIPLKLDELGAVLGVPSEDWDEFEKIIDELTNEGRIFVNKRGRYMAVNVDNGTVSGYLACSGSGFFGFVRTDEDEGDIYIHGDNMMNALHGDRVLVRLRNQSSKPGHREGCVIKVLERGSSVIIGTVFKKKNEIYKVSPDDKRIYANIRIFEDDMMDADLDERVAAEITDYKKDGKFYGRVISRLGEKESLKSCIEGIIIQNGIKQEFDPQTIAEAQNAPNEVSYSEFDGRMDYRQDLIFTIDGDDARDFDDAVSLKLLENGNYYLGVHIADVSEYVKEESALDKEAFFRGTSVYLADRVIPMLPKKLSNGICSLNPEVDRLTLSVMMEIDGNGQVVNHSIEKSVIRSNERMTYNDVNKLIAHSDDKLSQRYAHILPTIELMNILKDILYKRRLKRGSIQFDFPESKIEVDENGEPVDIYKEERGESQKLIEEFMLIANETVAEYAFWAEIPFVYRSHEAPSTEKILAFNLFAANFGLGIKGKIDDENPIHSKDLQKILDKVKGEPYERLIASTMLHSLMKADYRAENLGHFGLAAPYYCHFTSPIRRYPDLMIHRIIKTVLDGNLNDEKTAYFEGIVRDAAKRSSQTEVNAEYTERDVEDLMKTAYISNHVGESFTGVVARVASFGMFVELENSVDGLVRLENMTDDYYEFDAEKEALVGKRRQKIYKIGDSVNITVMKADIISRKIDFVLTKDIDKKMLARFSEHSKSSKGNSKGKRKSDRNKYYSKTAHKSTKRGKGKKHGRKRGI